MNKDEALTIISEMEEIVMDNLEDQPDYEKDMKKDIKRLKKYLGDNLK